MGHSCLYIQRGNFRHHIEPFHMMEEIYPEPKKEPKSNDNNKNSIKLQN